VWVRKGVGGYTVAQGCGPGLGLVCEGIWGRGGERADQRRRAWL